ncbi:hypothetical protein BC835DRAFT_1412978 [Cytidiella melzeri]|nr:hypothetical protein BC835DRAFT_1412978 [Cytidiella melzeri]
MAHLLRNPFQKPFEFPTQGPLLTPPETEPEYHIQHQQLHIPANTGLGIELDPAPSHQPASVTEVPISRRLQYITSGPREARDRTVQRGARWLVVVTPPSSFSQEHGQFGHSVSAGLPGRLVQGTLMPLLQTMSSQLAAIAREFAFPSTAGLCLYLHTSHGGYPITPRITDESWPVLWAHLLEPRTPPSTGTLQLPIGGKIEFDIDPSKARWLDAWLALLRRENLDVPVSVAPSRPESLSHFREDSRTTFPDDRTEEPPESTSLLLPPRPSRVPGHRHIPRKLSLLDRLESSSVRSGSRLRTRNSPSPPADPNASRRPSMGLSPIVQEDEPKTARKDIDIYVNTWRASASIVMPSPLAATGQTSLDPANLPNDMDFMGAENAGSELDLNDFQWSVSSAGPSEWEYNENFDSYSLESWRLPSVHMDRRAEGSVCLTPTTCTSFGPPDWDEENMYGPEFVALAMAAMLPTPDIGSRMLEDCPPTPSTATSWGPPLEWPPSPAHSTLSLARSVDIGQRCMSEVPLTPSTATSWGPPLSWPPSPVTPYRVDTPDVGQRTFDLDAPRLRRQSASDEDNEPWRNVWPYIGTEGAASSPYTFVFPQRPASPQAEPVPSQSVTQTPGPFAFGWPFFDVSTEARAVRVQAPPERSVEPHEPEDKQPAVRVKKLSPFTVVFVPEPEPVASTAQSGQQGLWNQVWPYASSSSETAAQPTAPWNHVSSRAVANAPSGPWNHVWPYSAASSEGTVTGGEAPTSVNYPYFNLYPAVYPNFELYPAMAGTVDHRAPTELVVHLEASYPTIQPYCPVYPHLEIYPGAPMQNVYSNPVVALSSAERSYYPAIDIYAPVYPRDVSMYPWNVYNLYPTVNATLQQDQLKDNQVLTLTPGYPTLNFYAPVYPYNLDMIYPFVNATAKHITSSNPLTTRLEAVYSSMEIYAPVYPYNLDMIYPPIKADDKHISLSAIPSTGLKAVYPYIEIYAPVYPYNLEVIYPPVMADDKHVSSSNALSPYLEAAYPYVEIYKSVYPYNLERIYPAIKVQLDCNGTQQVRGLREHGLKIRLSATYPILTIYSPVYPHNLAEIYPSVAVASTKHVGDFMSPIVVQLPARYPAFDLYPAVYPWNLSDIYPSVIAEAAAAVGVLQHNTQYPHVQPYRPVYPYNLDYIYPPISVAQEEKRPVRSSTKHRPLTHRAHHLGHHVKRSSSASKDPVPPVPPLPQNVQTLRPINPTSHKPLSDKRTDLSLPVQLPTSYPHIRPYPPVYPHLEIYPHIPGEDTSRPPAQSLLASRGKPSFAHLDLRERVLASSVTISPRRNARYTHLQLHQKVFGLSSPTSPRKLPVPPQPALASSIAPHSFPQGIPSPSLGARSRSGTISQRPIFPNSPSLSRSNSTTSSANVSPDGSPVKVSRRLPAIPLHGSPRGLPSDPAVIRRASMLLTANKLPPFSILPAVPEPNVMTSPSPVHSPQSPNRRPLPPKPSPSSPNIPDHPQSARTVSIAPLINVTAPTLSRANTLPSRPIMRTRRDTVTSPPGKVAGLMKTFNITEEQVPPLPPTGSLSSTLSQFPTPPRPPLPPAPNSRPVSKLDRSKYPYN